MLEEETPDSNRKIRAVSIATAAGVVLDIAAWELEQLEDPETTKRFQQDKIYNFCNYQIGIWPHLFTGGWCSWYTLGANLGELIQGRSVDYKGIANILSGFSFLIGLFSAERWIIEFIKKLTEPYKEQVIHSVCNKAEEFSGIEDTSFACSISIAIWSDNSQKIYENIRKILKKRLKN